MATVDTLGTYPDARRGWTATGILVAIGILAAMDQGVAGLLIDPMKRALHLTDVQIGLANATTFALAYGALATPMGMLADRRSRVWMLRGALVLWGIAMVLTAISPDLDVLVVSKVVLGLACAITYPAALSLIADYVPPRGRAFATGCYGTGTCVGQAGAILIGGLVYSALGHHRSLAGIDLSPWRAIYLGFAALSLLVIPAAWTLREPFRNEVEHARGSFAALWAHRRFLTPLLAGTLCLVGASSVVILWSAPALMRLYGETPGLFAGWFSAVTLGAGASGLLAGGALAELLRRRTGAGRIMTPAAFAAVLCAPGTLLALMPSVFWFAVAAAVFSLAYGVAATLAVVAINFRVPNELRGMAMGMSVVTMAAASALFPTLTAVVNRYLGGHGALGAAIAAVAAPCALLAALCFAACDRTASVTAVLRQEQLTLAE